MNGTELQVSLLERCLLFGGNMYVVLEWDRTKLSVPDREVSFIWKVLFRVFTVLL